MNKRFSSDNETPKLSIVIRCRNEAKSLRNTFAALNTQRSQFAWEVIIVDNESEDETQALCREFGARIVPISRREFTYGRAINVGIEAARGDLVMLLSAHALPIGSYFLQSAVAPFDDPMVAAARCLQIGNVRQISRWYQPKDIHYRSPEDQKLAEASADWSGEYPAGGCCVLRRSVWEQVKYDEHLESNEDKHWASRVLAEGFKIRCCAEAIWLYTRQYGRRESWRRNNRQQMALYRLTGKAPLSWRSYFFLALRTFLAAPLVAVRYIADNLMWNTYLATIPWQARRAPQAGSYPEFDRKPSPEPRARQ